MREQWDNSPELRQSIERELDNWGNWSRQGSSVKLMFPDSSPWTTSPDRFPAPPVNISMAEATERVISTWGMASESGRRGAFLLKLSHIERRPLETIQHDFHQKFKENRSCSVLDAMVDEARMFYWMLTTK